VGLVEIALDVKAGKRKLSELKPATARKVSRLLPDVEPRSKATPIHSHATFYARPRKPKT
jgi:hypothetical protein